MKQKITINDIARLAGVSKATVSFYLNGKYERMSEATRQRIEAAIRKTDYRPSMVARSLNFKQTHLIGVIIGDITNSFAAQIVKGVDEVCRSHDYQMIVGDSGYELKNEHKCVTSMAAMGVDGFIVQPTVHFETMWNEQHLEKPIVYFDSPNSLDKGLWVKTNNYEAVLEATDMLVSRGYQRFVMVTADPYVLHTRLERNRGFTDCLDERGIPYEVIMADASTTADMIEEKLKPYLNGEQPTCVFACNNWLLDKTYLVLRKYSSLMPQYLGLIGFDSLEWTELAVPSITTIVQPAYEEGKCAARVLIDAIEGTGKEAPNHILMCRINEMTSTKRNVSPMNTEHD